MTLKILAKKHVDRILRYLNEYGECYFGQIKSELEIDQSSLSTLLTELVNEEYISKREEQEGYKLPKSYYKLTELGKYSLIIYEEFENMQKMKSKFHNEINGDVGQVINIDKADGLEINFKKEK
ncbi:DNA-binding HxlR family transcriptional regulator [Methanococcus maripaludis]|uniref:DNA-binding HxlR family transcriptional regulator n=1 Tax=Methanococcus maripaludis TaxID=39152 RepID=A0A7J9S970_METMI|nr:transcriptional regulator [Methanococcus maripaludis]MBB6402453.1 DNA-binding HxlR family transcriptional regulator [Methanococcus maripaludis]